MIFAIARRYFRTVYTAPTIEGSSSFCATKCEQCRLSSSSRKKAADIDFNYPKQLSADASWTHYF
ncbi:MAG: hypothetical protein ACI915_003082 [Gammaproteobacteria bacterium]|jgi:hypothetical protein